MVLLLWLAGACAKSDPGEPRAGFFVTRDGNPTGGDLGGLAGADRRCENLASAAGLPEREWRAFLSAAGPIHARDRIGEGPWTNTAGETVAESVDDLIRDGIPSSLMRDETGARASKSDPPGIEHDMLTGSDEQGRFVAGRTCADWTSSSRADAVLVGHHDWSWLPSDDWKQSFISVHRAPCDLEGMARQFGSARFYCFALDP